MFIAVLYEIQLSGNGHLGSRAIVWKLQCFVFLLELFIEHKQLIPLQMRLMA